VADFHDLNRIKKTRTGVETPPAEPRTVKAIIPKSSTPNAVRLTVSPRSSNPCAGPGNSTVKQFTQVRNSRGEAHRTGPGKNRHASPDRAAFSLAISAAPTAMRVRS
jgi:hypothetical protein